jgi:hypothetical protein
MSNNLADYKRWQEYQKLLQEVRAGTKIIKAKDLSALPLDWKQELIEAICLSKVR